MSGRGRGYRGGRSSHRGGRGRGRSNRSSSQKSSQAAKPAATRKTLADHVYSIGSAKQASDYTVIVGASTPQTRYLIQLLDLVPVVLLMVVERDNNTSIN